MTPQERIESLRVQIEEFREEELDLDTAQQLWHLLSHRALIRFLGLLRNDVRSKERAMLQMNVLDPSQAVIFTKAQGEIAATYALIDNILNLAEQGAPTDADPLPDDAAGS